MKQDMDLIKIFLETLAEDDSYYMLLDDFAHKIQEKTNETEAFNNKFMGHFFLAKDAKLIDELGICFFTGQQYPHPMAANGGKLRITSQGLDFLDALHNDTVFQKIKHYSLGVAKEAGKSLLSAIISKCF